MPTLNNNLYQTPRVAATETFARDAIIAWFRGEFAAANAIIDALCSHIVQLDQQGDNDEDKDGDYDMLFAAIHRRRMNWIPILQMQKYQSIGEVSFELKRMMAKKSKKMMIQLKNNLIEDKKILARNDDVENEDDSPESDITTEVNVARGLKVYEDVTDIN